MIYSTRPAAKLGSIEISIDIMCLSRRPLHVTPVFRFNGDDKETNCVRSWVDISFWKSSERYSKRWIPRCKIYEIRMMGVMEKEVSAICIDYLPKASSTKSLEEVMAEYDENMFIMNFKHHTKELTSAANVVTYNTSNNASTDSAFPPMLLIPKVSSPIYPRRVHSRPSFDQLWWVQT
ncbi:hypothetical protein TRICI_004382 [Trichomonascus ciferrii]|uniref:Uncharacterized protein n=1 Tax=Trichomonascus ciferrii TaxID=44093 RepID=A0A642V627_9ASCO|nr:hypothetical protein TRICI_004382 [Trichomonascus ciferrii]